MKKFLLFFIIWITSFSCVDIDNMFGIHQWRTYVIDAGNHYSDGLHVSSFHEKEIDFLCQFDQTCAYDLGNVHTQSSINKLFGFSDCTSDHHENSARLGWRWNITKQKIEIFGYVYKNSNVSWKYICDVNLGDTNNCSISYSGDSYTLGCNGNYCTMGRGCDGMGGAKYVLYPYFGGDVAAPHNMYIKIRI